MKRTIFCLWVMSLAVFAGQPPRPSYIQTTDGVGTNTTLIAPAVVGTLTGDVTKIQLGDSNEILGNSHHSAAIGGFGNVVEEFSDFNAIVGGSLNVIPPNTASSFIGGGDQNVVESGACSAIVGGLRNETHGNDNNVIMGGSYNYISQNCGWSYVLAGDSCSVDSVPGGDYNGILGGYHNITTAPGRYYMQIWGGTDNQVSASEAWVIGSGIRNTTPSSIEMGLRDNAKVRITSGGVVLVGLPLIVQDTNGVSFTRIYTQDGKLYSEPVSQ